MKQFFQTIQLPSPVDEKVVSVFGSHEPVALCCAPFFESGNHDGTNATLGRDVGLPQSSEGQPSVDHISRRPFST